MKIFLSSVIRGLEPFRDAAAHAVRTLRHSVIRAEDFGASPTSPQVVCLAAVRDADLIVLLLGADYGSPGSSGLSPTHEEYREARDRKDVLVFIQKGVKREADQAAFLKEVQAWSKGSYTEEFSTSDDLKDALVRALHELEMSRKSGPIDETELLDRASKLLPDREGRTANLVVAAAGAPKQPILRPAELEAPQLAELVKKAALFGPHRVFNQEEGSKVKIVRGQLLVEQESASILLTPLGDVRVIQPAISEPESSGMHFSVLIEEDVRASIDRALRFAAVLLDEIDPRRRLSWILPIAALTNGSFAPWLTRAEAAKTRNGYTMSTSNAPTIVSLSPAVRPRASLDQQAAMIAEDLTVLMRRERKA